MTARACAGTNRLWSPLGAIRYPSRKATADPSAAPLDDKQFCLTVAAGVEVNRVCGGFERGSGRGFVFEQVGRGVRAEARTLRERQPRILRLRLRMTGSFVSPMRLGSGAIGFAAGVERGSSRVLILEQTGRVGIYGLGRYPSRKATADPPFDSERLRALRSGQAFGCASG